MLTRSASYPDRETAQWATQQVVTANEQAIHRWLAQGTRARPLCHRVGRLRLLRRPGLTLTPRAGPVRRGALPFTGQTASTMSWGTCTGSLGPKFASSSRGAMKHPPR
ncbi:hypothetical protein ACFRCI_04940 [Streptomyces sp. NPDC056638]|uniref:hypothetical protein n=1 Tax=Streptomyces sp. NPDC056638 TaxID=3345887 RepID=UPI0036934604